MLAKILSPSALSRSSVPEKTPPPSNGTDSQLLSPNSANNNNNPNKRKSPFGNSSPRKSRSPTKVPRTPDAHSSGTANNSPSAFSRPAINNILNAEDLPPRSSIERDTDADAVDILMEEDEPMGEDAPRNGEEGEEDGEDVGEGEEADSEDEEDEEDDEEDSGDESDDSDTSDIVVIGPDGERVTDVAPGVRVKSEPADAAAPQDGTAAPAQGEEVVNQLQPKKKKSRRRSPSSDEDLPPPPPPMPTIRLEVKFDPSGDTLDFNFLTTAALEGYAVVNAWGEDPLQNEQNDEALATEAPTEALIEGTATPADPFGGLGADASQAEMEEIARRLEAKYDKPTKKSKPKRKVLDRYDETDDFIDDSELATDAPTHVARPKKDGFFVHMGELELMEVSPQKLSSRSRPKVVKKETKPPRKTLSQALREKGTPREHFVGSQMSPIMVDSDAENELPIIKRSPSPEDKSDDNRSVDRTLFKNASRDERYLPPFSDFPDEVGHFLRKLRRQSSRHVWDPQNKGKFPDALRPYLRDAGKAAFQNDWLCVVDKDVTDSNYDRYQEKAFVTALCSVLPYNKLTLGKLVLKLVYDEYWKWLQAKEKEGLKQWKDLLEPEIPAMVEQYEQELAKHEVASLNEPMEITEDGEAAKNKPPAEVRKQPFFSPDMKDIFRQLVENTQEMVDINKKMEEWNQRIEGQSSELNMRKFLYTKIINLYPEGYMTSLALSRAFTNFKRSGQGARAREEAVAGA